MSNALLTIPMSHYCEKVRWALERADTPYVELGRLQGLHYPAAYWYGRGPYVPVWIPESGAPVADSTAILKHLDRGVDALYPSDSTEVDALEESFDTVLGVETRRWVYQQSLGHPELVTFAAFGTPAWHAPAGRAMYGLIRRFITKRLDVRESTVADGMARIAPLLDGVEQRLSDGRRYLTGDAFTAADLTFACMLAPVVLPDNYGIPLPDPALLGDSDTIARMRDRPAGQFALRLFEEDRPVPAWRRTAG